MSDPTRSPYEPTVPLSRAEPHQRDPYAPDPYAPDPYQPDPYAPAPYPRPQGYGRAVPQHPVDGGRNPYEQPDPYEQAYPQAPYPQPPYPQPVVYLQPVDPRQLAYQQSIYAAQKSRVAAGLLAIFLGSFGVHNFYLGRTGVAVAQLLITVLTLGLGAAVVSIWALIEGILILTRSPGFATDARGIPLRE